MIDSDPTTTTPTTLETTVARRIPAVALLTLAAAGLAYALYMLLAPSELILGTPGGPETGRINCTTGTTSGEFVPSAADVQASCAEAAADEEQHAMIGAGITVLAGAGGALLLLRRRAAVTPQ